MILELPEQGRLEVDLQTLLLGLSIWLRLSASLLLVSANKLPEVQATLSISPGSCTLQAQ